MTNANETPQPESDDPKGQFSEDGERRTPTDLLPKVYHELRALAARELRSGRAGHTLQPTALVHEAYLKLLPEPSDQAAKFEGDGHFLAVAAQAMRHILVDHARRRGARKRGGDWQRVTISRVSQDEAEEFDVLDLEEALQGLGQESPRPARVAELRLFAGLSVEQVAEVLGVSSRTVKYDWRFARAWLQSSLDSSA